MRAIFDLDVLLVVKIVGNLSRYLHLITRWVKARDAANPTYTVPGGLPKLLAADAIRANGANSCDRYTTCQLCFAFVPLASIG